jgi:spore coat protein CotH
LQAVGRFLDVDRFLTFVAMETLTARWDGYARNRANYRLYHDPTTERMVFIPHGMVGAFAGTNVTALPPTRRLLGKAVFQTEPGRRAHRQRLRELFERFKVEATGEGVNRFEDAYYRAWPLR